MFEQNNVWQRHNATIRGPVTFSGRSPVTFKSRMRRRIKNSNTAIRAYVNGPWCPWVLKPDSIGPAVIKSPFHATGSARTAVGIFLLLVRPSGTRCRCPKSCGIRSVLWTVPDSVFSALKVCHENALYKFTCDIWHDSISFSPPQEPTIVVLFRYLIIRTGCLTCHVNVVVADATSTLWVTCITKYWTSAVVRLCLEPKWSCGLKKPAFSTVSIRCGTSMSMESSIQHWTHSL